MNQANLSSRIVGAAILIAVGVLMLVGQGLSVNIWTVGWPFIIIAVGAALFIGMLARGRGEGGALAIPSIIIMTAGGILFVENNLNNHQVWTYAWPLMVIAVGAGLLLKGFWNGESKSLLSGTIVAVVGVVLFGGNLLTNGGRMMLWIGNGELIGGIALVLGGLALLFFRQRPAESKTDKVDQVRQ